MLHQSRSVTLRSEFWLGEPYILKHGMKIAEVLLMFLQVPMKFRVCRVCKSSHNKRCTPVILKDSTEACLLQGENSLQRLLSPPLLSLKMYLDCYCWQSKKAHTLGPWAIRAGTLKKAKCNPIMRIRSQHMLPVDVLSWIILETSRIQKELHEVACRYW